MKVTKPKQTTIKKANRKKLTAAKIKISLSKIQDAKGYQLAVYQKRKNAKQNKQSLIKKIYQKTSIVIASKKLKNQKKLYVKARAYRLNRKFTRSSKGIDA